MRKLVLAVLCIAACGGDDGGGGGIRYEDIPELVMSRYCDYAVRCGGVDSVAICREQGFFRQQDADVGAAIAAGKVIFHGDRAKQCLDQTFDATCDKNALFGRPQPVACSTTFEGTVGDMGQCAIDEECISQDCSVPSCPDACCQGTCVGGSKPVRPGLGQPCSTGAGACLEGYCDMTAGLCAAFKTSGACNSSTECELGYGCIMQMCTAQVATGGACMTNANCREVGDICNGGMCVKAGLLGASCMTQAQCSSFGVYVCDATQHCAYGPRLGETCTPTMDRCIGTFCSSSTTKCTAPQADGATCAGNDECASDDCDTTTMKCVPPPPACF